MKQIRDKFPEILAISLFCLMFSKQASSWVSEWSNLDSFYAFGFFMLGFIFYVIRENYQKYSNIELKPSWVGIIFLIFGLCLYVFGVRADYEYIANASVPAFLVGAFICFRGIKFTKTVLFTVILFTFALPVLPLHRITMPFQLLSAKATTFILSFLGLNAFNEGNSILLENQRISVVAGCSGLKSLYSIFFICVIYAYFINSSLFKKIWFVILSIPLALAMNILRILSVSFFVLYNGHENAESFHDNAGIVVYILSIGIIVFSAGLINKKPEEKKEELS
jgi:exosortase